VVSGVTNEGFADSNDDLYGDPNDFKVSGDLNKEIFK